MTTYNHLLLRDIRKLGDNRTKQDYLTALDWKVQGKPENSCLIPIDETFNSPLVSMGEPAIPEFSHFNR